MITCEPYVLLLTIVDLHLYLFHLWNMYCFIDSFCDEGSEHHLVLLERIPRIIFEELDLIWLARMWCRPSE